MTWTTSLEIRNWVGLTTADKPTNTVIEFLRDQAEVILDAEVDGGSDAMYKVCSLMLSGSYVLRWLAGNTVKDGYNTFSVGGELAVTKSYAQLIESAEKWELKYKDIAGLMVNADAIYTQFLPAAGLDSLTIEDIKGIYQDTANMWDFEMKYKPGISSRRTGEFI